MSAWDLDTPSSWLFPPALNRTFRNEWLGLSQPSNATAPGIDTLIVGAVRNLTSEQRAQERDAETRFGATSSSVVRVGDVLVVKWKEEEEDDIHRGNRTLSLNCVTCSRGQELAGIFEACENYTDSAHLAYPMDTFTMVPLPSSSSFLISNYTLPDLSRDVDIPRSACGICILTLYTARGYSSIDYSIPFPVQQAQRKTPYRFDEENPTGVQDVSISVFTADIPTSLNDARPVENNKPDVGMIVGVVVGVLVGVVVIAVLCWIAWWRRKRMRTKTVHSNDSSPVEANPDDARRDEAAMELSRLRRIQGVVRRPDTTVGEEVPPTYHEAIGEGNNGRLA